MGIATMQAPCGCVKSRLMEPDEDVWITWVACKDHYDPEKDDEMIANAAKNRREYCGEAQA